MKLKLSQQLLTLASLTLILPPLAWWWMGEADAVLRDSLGESRQQLARLMAVEIQSQLNEADSGKSKSHVLFVPLIRDELIAVDGYSDDWEAIGAGSKAGQGIRVQLAKSNTMLYAFINVSEHNWIYSQPQNPGDQLIVQLSGESTLKRLRYRFEGLGQQLPSSADSATRKMAVQDDPVNRGQTIELAIELDKPLESIKIELLSKDQTKRQLGPLQAQFRSPRLDHWLAKQVVDGAELFVLDRKGHIISSSSQPGSAKHQGNLWMSLLYRWLVAKDVEVYDWPNNHQYAVDMDAWKKRALQTPFWSTNAEGSSISISVLVPVGSSHWLLFHQNAEQVLVLGNQGVVQFGLVFLLLTMIIMLAFVGYASWLAWRVRRLNRVVVQEFETGSDKYHKALFYRDEIGELARSFARQQKKIQANTEYLEQLGSRLAHELRTPMSIVQGALENLLITSPGLADNEQAKRAQVGVNRLQKILLALREASQMNDMVGQIECVELDMNLFLENYMKMMQQNYPGIRIFWKPCSYPVMVLADPDLIAQMMDKLLDNARSFVRLEGEISVRLQKSNDKALVLVANDGPPLPDDQQQIFQSLTSAREAKHTTTSPHLGLGLYIVQLIIKAHNGEVRARNIAGRKRVEFRLSFPLIIFE
ncbi:MAG: ATP-binding protein [bacterium]